MTPLDSLGGIWGVFQGKLSYRPSRPAGTKGLEEAPLSSLSLKFLKVFEGGGVRQSTSHSEPVVCFSGDNRLRHPQDFPKVSFITGF